MSASIGSSAISPDDPRLTTIPQRIPFIPPAPTTPYELRLVHHGMTKAATRAAVNRVLAKIYNSGQSRFDRTDTWHAPLFTMMLRSDSYHAGQLARQQDEHYRFFGEMSKSQFTRFDIQFLSTAGNPDAVALDRQAIRKIRSILDQHITVPRFNKIGSWQHPVKINCLGVSIKVLVCERLLESIRDKIIVALSNLNVKACISGWHVFDRENFNDEIRSIVAPDLPLDGEMRADFEFLLRGIDQISYSGLSKEDAARFALIKKDNANQDAQTADAEGNPIEIPVDSPVPAGSIRLSNIPRSQIGRASCGERV